jgi:antiviral defense system Shedu protein SduA
VDTPGWQSNSGTLDFCSQRLAESVSLFRSIDLDISRAADEFIEFKKFLQDNATFSERQVVNELKKRLHLSCLMGSLIAGVPRSNVYKFEFQIQGVFRADLVVGNSLQKRFVLVEFESGRTNSLFGPTRTNQMRDWSRQFERGFGQLVDWAWAKHDAGNTQIFRNAFGCDDMSTASLLVCGRDTLMDATEQKRFFWRCHNIGLAGTSATCLTYDGLLVFLRRPWRP